MTGFPSRWGALVLVVAASVYLVASLSTGRSAASQVAPDLSAAGAALSPHSAVALLVREQDRVIVLDVRSPAEFAAYHVAGSVSLPGGGPERLRAVLGGRTTALVVAGNDEIASRLVAGALAGGGPTRWHFIAGGARALYLAFELPVRLFAAADPPFGYEQAARLVRTWLGGDRTASPADVLRAVETLATSDYSPTELGAKKAGPRSSKKKVTGGCG